MHIRFATRLFTKTTSTALASATALLFACSSDISTGDHSVTDLRPLSQDAADAGSSADLGGRVADFTHAAICTGSWLSYDLSKPIRFAVEVGRGTLPNGSASVRIAFTALRASAQVLESAQTIGTTFFMPDEFVGSNDFFDNVPEPHDALLSVPSEATTDSHPIEMNVTNIYGSVPKHDLCAWFVGTLKQPVQQNDAQLRCLFYENTTTLPTPTSDEFLDSACANNGLWHW